jgi:hypothetical protein
MYCDMKESMMEGRHSVLKKWLGCHGGEQVRAMEGRSWAMCPSCLRYWLFKNF